MQFRSFIHASSSRTAAGTLLQAMLK